MKSLTTILLLFVATTVFSQHTFSIVAVDPVTGEIGSAGATCLAFEDGALAISDIVLATGAIHTQSFYNTTNQNNARIRMEAGDSPQEIMDWLVANDVSGNPATRQYVAVDLNSGSPRSAAFTGADCFEDFIDITGPNYAIAGNILISDEVVEDMETAFLNTSGTLADKLMAALQGAKRPGADERCLGDGVSSLSAFLRVADPSDTSSAYGDLSLDLNVWVTGAVFEPIDALQDAYDATLLNVTENELDAVGITLYPNPAKETVTVRINNAVATQYQIVDIAGKVVLSQDANKAMNQLYLNISSLSKGVYFVNLYNNRNRIGVKKLIVE